MFKTKYRIEFRNPSDTLRYQIQQKKWFYPIWMNIGWTFSSLRDAETEVKILKENR